MQRVLTRSAVCALGLALLCGARTAGAASKGRPIVAVFNIESKGARLGRAVLDRLGGYLTTKLAASGAYKVIPRAQIKRRMTRQKKRSYRNCYAQSCQIELGKELAASHSLSCKLLKIGRRCILTAELYDLRTATTSAAATARGGCGEDAVVGLIDRAVGQLTGDSARPTRAKVSGRSGRSGRPGAAMVLLRGGKPTSGLGSLSRGQIQRVINRGMPGIQRCYEQGLRILPSLSGRVVVDFAIGVAGRVTKASIVKSTMTFPSVEGCIIGQVRRMVFSRPTGGSVMVRYPFVFRISGSKPPLSRNQAHPTPRWIPPSTPGPDPFAHSSPTLTRSQIQTGMRRVAKQVQRCYDRFKKPGMVKIKLVIANLGGVQRAQIKGRFAGTPTGACVRAAVLKARFPRYSGKPVIITYPFILR